MVGIVHAPKPQRGHLTPAVSATSSTPRGQRKRLNRHSFRSQHSAPSRRGDVQKVAATLADCLLKEVAEEMLHLEELLFFCRTFAACMRTVVTSQVAAT